jgi:hypothetical protein
MNIKVYQNFHLDRQIKHLDPAFLPHDRTRNEYPEYRETGVFLDFYRSKGYLEAEFTGIVSPKFCDKTRISGSKFIEFIERNPGFDVYFINPFPQTAYWEFNIWTQGEHWHPGIIALAQKLFDDVAYPIRIADLGRNDHNTLLYCNYWIGNARFWHAYMSFITPLFDHITKELPESERTDYFAVTQYDNPTPIFPFIFERLFSTIMMTDRGIRGCPYRHTRDEILLICGEEVEKDIVTLFGDLIDERDRRPIAYGDAEKKIFSVAYECLASLRLKRKEFLALRHQYECTQRQLEGVLNSRSWKLTWILRKGNEVFHRLKQGIRSPSVTRPTTR